MIASCEDLTVKLRVCNCVRIVGIGKPNYSNASGLEVYDAEKWADWYGEDGEGIWSYMASTWREKQGDLFCEEK